MSLFIKKLLCVLPLLAPGLLWAQPYPDRPVRIVVPYSAGATNDIVARAIAQRLSIAFKQNFIVDNKAGGNGTIGTAFVAKEPADGYNVLFGNTSTLGIHPSLFPKLPYDPVKDFQAVSIIAESPTVLVVNAAIPVRTIKELVAYSKANPMAVAYGSPGTGTPFHLSGELFNIQTGTTMLHVPYKGAAPAVVDLLGGQIQVMFDNLPNVLNHIRSGKLRALAVTSEARLSQLPDVPTIAEAGIPGFSVTSYFALFTPTGTPMAVIKALNAATNQALALPDLQEKFAQQGASPAPGTPEDLGNLTTSEIKKWGAVLKAANIKFD